MHELDDTKALKVTLPVAQHLQLHKLKILSDRTISEIVRDALDDYMEDLDEDDEIPAMAEEVAPP